MSNNDSNKPNHSFFIDVAKIVTAGVILLFCTTLYNLFLAHIWPVSIHFGEYSLNNFIFIFVAVLSSFILAIIILALEIFYVLHTLASGLIYLTLNKHKMHLIRAKLLVSQTPQPVLTAKRNRSHEQTFPHRPARRRQQVYNRHAHRCRAISYQRAASTTACTLRPVTLQVRWRKIGVCR